uniref:Transposase n=1 Tax=Leptobrachium leishanense TaxID=445787 RepID=A0A8C5P8K5_9ANUR
MCLPLVKGPKVMGQLASQLFHGQVCDIPSLPQLQCADKRSTVHFKCAICIWNLLLSTLKMRSKELSLSVKQAIIRLKKQNKPIREIARTLGVAKTTVWNTLKKKERTGELSNTNRPGRPGKTTVVDDRIILSLVKKTPFTTVGQIKNTPQEVGVCVSKSTIKRRLHQSEYRGFTTRCKPLGSLKNRKARLEFAKQHLTKPSQFWNKILVSSVHRINLYQSDGKRRVWRRKGTAHDPKHTTSPVKHGGGSVMAWACMAANGTGSLVFIDDVTDKSSRMNSEVFRAILSAHIQPNAAELIGRCFTVQLDNDPKHTAKATKEFLKGQKWNVIQWSSQSPDLNPIEHAFHLLKTKLKGKCPKNKQELKTVAVEAWQSITRDETQRLVMSMRSRLQAVIDCKGFATKY